ncbi:MAG: TonB-dependent receptor [Gammaproteobacteria bacterium]|nr:TonB-dependent receptor [Gammaproteobacteria bacterium]
MHTRRYAATAFLCLYSAWALADMLPPVIVTATRTAQTEDETLAAVTVFTREDIDKAQVHSIPELLRGTPGLTFANQGGLGKSTSLFLRGTASDHVLVLLDGIKIGSATLGTVALQDIPLDVIERIEIVRGPRSSLYGSEALGGVIQIFTRKGDGDFHWHASAGAGRYDTYRAAAGVTGGQDVWFNAEVSGLRSSGLNACSGKAGVYDAGCGTDEPDRDGNQNLSTALRGGFRLPQQKLSADVHALYARGKSQYDGGSENNARSAQRVVGGVVAYAPLNFWQVTATGGRAWDLSDNYRDDVWSSRFYTRRDTLSVQNDLTLTKAHTITVGADYQSDTVDSDTAYEVTSRRNGALFSQYQGSVVGQDVQLSLRKDLARQIGQPVTGSIAWGHTFSPAFRLTASAGSAFKAPTFNQLYYPGYANPNLLPEKARSVEVGLSGAREDMRWSLHAYRTLVTNLIGYDSAYIPYNVDQARLQGLEGTVSTRVLGCDLRSQLGLLHAINTTGDYANLMLPRRAPYTLRVDADHAFGSTTVGATLNAEGRRYDDAAHQYPLGAFATVDLRTEYRVTRALRVQAALANMFAKHYETAAYYNQPGRSLNLLIHYQQ